LPKNAKNNLKMSKKGSCYKGFPQFPQGFPQYRSLLWKTDRFWFSAFKNRFLLQNSAVFFGKKPCFFKIFYKKYCKEEKSVIYYLTVEYTVEWRVGFSKPALPFSKS
jgi:hypothetical protein